MDVTCDHCGKVFNRKPSQVGKVNYCSKECSSTASRKRTLIMCCTCGKEVYKFDSDIKSSKSGELFCSRSCAVTKNNSLRRNYQHPNWKGGKSHNYYRTAALRELPNKCQVCGYDNIPEILQVHHIDEDRLNNSISNLQILCPNCHAEKHWGPEGSLRKQLEVGEK